MIDFSSEIVPPKPVKKAEKKEQPVEISADMFSKSAIEKLEKAGGKAIFK